ncbi:enoyl-CoA hydratase/isomerase family protein [Peptococcus simiae]|uniref:enoyl-CoA hydratase/isomerase family protein n=1 Tax=Peptococcus simiae TaxID=1643805 RepID=UPI00398165FD
MELTIKNKVGIIHLNRPDKLNALSLDDIQQMQEALEKWLEDPAVHWILFEGEGKAFSAGGDVKALYDYSLATGDFPGRFFKAEFALDQLVHAYPKPVVVLYKGVTMGGGIGLTVNADLRVTDDSLIWAMPETQLGFMPDVAMGWYFSRLDRADGLYLSLLGGRLDWQDAIHYGFADLGIRVADRAAARQALLELATEGLSYEDMVAALKAALAPFTQASGQGAYQRDLAPLAKKYFDKDQLGAIMAHLQRGYEPFAAESLAGLLSRSPLAVAVTFLKYAYGKGWTREETFRVDLDLLAFLWDKAEPMEGIRATMVDKNHRPAYWRHSYGDLDWPALHAFFEDRSPQA